MIIRCQNIFGHSALSINNLNPYDCRLVDYCFVGCLLCGRGFRFGSAAFLCRSCRCGVHTCPRNCQAIQKQPEKESPCIAGQLLFRHHLSHSPHLAARRHIVSISNWPPLCQAGKSWKQTKPTSVIRPTFQSISSLFRSVCRFARNLLFILWGITLTFLNVPKSVAYLPQRSSMRLQGSMLRRSLSYRFPICFPSFYLCETENDGKTSE